jgi:hypothetical protein
MQDRAHWLSFVEAKEKDDNLERSKSQGSFLLQLCESRGAGIARHLKTIRAVS